ERTFSHALHAYVGDMDDADVTALRADARVAYVQPVHGVSLSSTLSVAKKKQLPKGIGTSSGGQILPWGVTGMWMSATASRSTFSGDPQGSVLCDVYIVDTAISTQSDLNAATDVNLKGGPNTDCDGHGTHMAGIIGAMDNNAAVVGVAPGVRVHGVKVLDCDG